MIIDSAPIAEGGGNGYRYCINFSISLILMQLFIVYAWHTQG